MSNRIYDRALCLDKQVVFLFGNFVVGSTGAVGSVKGLGISGVVRNSTGNYTITLSDAYSRYLYGDASLLHNTNFSGVSNVEIQQDPATFQSSFQTNKTITLQCYDNSGSAVDPAVASVLGFMVVARRSSVGIS